MALTDNLIEYWKLDEASGSRVGQVNSLTLSENGGTINSGTGLVYPAGAADFESGSSQYLSRTDGTELSTGDIDFTVACWYKPESLPADGTFMTLMNKRTTGFEYDMFIAGTPTIQHGTFGAYGGGNFPSVGSSTDLSVGVWYLAIGWHDSVNNLIGFRHNNEADNTTASLGAGTDTTDPFHIGGRSGAHHFDGLIGPAMFWKRVLTSDERTQLYNSGAGLTYAEMSAAVGLPFITQLDSRRI